MRSVVNRNVVTRRMTAQGNSQVPPGTPTSTVQ